MTDAPHSVGTLFEQIANELGFERLEERYSALPHPLICWGVLIFVVDLFVLQLLKEFEGYRATFFTNPAWVVQPVLGLLTPFVVVYLHRRYETVLHGIDVDSRTTEPSAFDALAPPKLRLAFYVVLISYALWSFTVNVGMQTVTQIGGVSELVGVVVVLPLGYGVIFAEFLATYVGILIYFPRKIRETDFKINFLDPEGLGGLRPVGELMKSAYYFLMVGLIGFVIVLYGPSLLNGLTGSSYPDPGLVRDLLFTLVWLLGIGTMGYGLSQIHWFMKREKREQLTELDRAARALVEDPFEMSSFEISDENAYDDIRRRMEYINNTQEYPTTFTMWVQISVGILLPKAVQLALSYV